MSDLMDWIEELSNNVCFGIEGGRCGARRRSILICDVGLGG